MLVIKWRHPAGSRHMEPQLGAQPCWQDYQARAYTHYIAAVRDQHTCEVKRKLKRILLGQQVPGAPTGHVVGHCLLFGVGEAVGLLLRVGAWLVTVHLWIRQP